MQARTGCRTNPSPRTTSTSLVIALIGLLLLLASLDQTIVPPLYGKFGDLYGRRNTIFVSVALFLGGSVLSGASQSMIQLIGGLAIVTLGTMLLTRITADMAYWHFAAYSTVFGLGALFAPLTISVQQARLWARRRARACA